MKDSYLIFGDESGQDGSNRFGCLAKISGHYDNMKSLNKELDAILKKHKKSEIKFHKIKGFDYTVLGKEFIELGIENIAKRKIKLNVLVWDKQDRRHNVKNRCDTENLKRMYYHNLKNVKRNWNIDATWGFFPDEFSAINWEQDVVKYIQNTNFSKNNFSQNTLFYNFNQFKFPDYKKTLELESHKYPLLQLADLFAGIVRTSRDKSFDFDFFIKEIENNQQLSLFDFEPNFQITKNLRPKLEVMLLFKKLSNKYRLGVNFSKSKYFKTFNMSSGVFIHHYEPQHELDFAPTKINFNSK